MGIDQSDKLQANIDRPYCTPKTRDKAYSNLVSLGRRGKLPPVLDGTGDPVADYADILGLKP